VIKISKRDQIIKELNNFPERLLDEVLDYVKYLKGKLNRGIMETMMLSESSLKKDWNRPEEDEAWQNL
jgi:hypothetical protein